jgi:hypothetical protein
LVSGGCGRACRAGLQQRRKLGRQRAGLEFAGHALDGQRLLALLLQPGQRRLEDVGRRLAEAALALAMEMNRRGMQPQQDGRRLDRLRGAAAIFPRQFLEAEFGLAADLPEEFRLDAFRFRLGALEQFARRRGCKAQQHVGGLHLDALAGAGFDLERGRVVGEHGAGLESAVLFEQDIHRESLREGRANYTRATAISTSLCTT